MATPSIELILAGVSAFFSVVLTAVVGIIGWYFRKYVLSEVEENSAFRRYLMGEGKIEESKGRINDFERRFDRIENKMDTEHSEVRERLVYLTMFVETLYSAVNRELDADVDPPDPQFDRDFTRGGGQDPSDD